MEEIGEFVLVELFAVGRGDFHQRRDELLEVAHIPQIRHQIVEYKRIVDELSDDDVALLDRGNVKRRLKECRPEEARAAGSLRLVEDSKQ